MIKIGKYYTIESKTSSNNGRVVKVLNIYEDTNMARVCLCNEEKTIGLSLKSLRKVSKYDIIRNLDDASLENIIKKSMKKKDLINMLNFYEEE